MTQDPTTAPTPPMPPSPPTPPGEPPPPVAQLRRIPRWSWFWVLPPAALVLAVALGYGAWRQSGPRITLMLSNGHGLKAGDQVRYRGIQVGSVDQVELAPGGGGVIARITLGGDASDCARAGTLLWVVRPQVGLAGITGLETLVGARYVGVLPGRGGPRTSFVALEEPPVADALEAGGIDITVQAAQRGSLRPGAPVLYRQVLVGSVLSVALASDASAIEARVRIRAPFVQLVRTRTMFWDAGGLDFSAGLTGVSLRMDSLESLATGGIAFATPPEAGTIVPTGHRYALYQRPEPEWLAWKPQQVIEASRPSGLSLPQPLSATLTWRADHFWRDKQQRRQGWLLAVEGGLLGPADMLRGPPGALPESLRLELAGEALAFSSGALWDRNGVALMPGGPMITRLAATRLRPTTVPEDVLLVADPSEEPMTLAAARLESKEGHWLIDPAMSLPPGWHGAVAVALRDGAVVGVVLVEHGLGRIGQLPEPKQLGPAAPAPAPPKADVAPLPAKGAN